MKRGDERDEQATSDTPLQDQLAARGIKSFSPEALALLPTEMLNTRRAAGSLRHRPANVVTPWQE